MKKMRVMKAAAGTLLCGLTAVFLITAIAADYEWTEPEAEEVVTEADAVLEEELIRSYAGMEDISEHVCRKVSEDGIVYYSHYFPQQTIMPATCTEDGYIDRVCEACGEHERQVIPAYGHYMVDGVCIECGYSEDGQYVPEETPAPEEEPAAETGEPASAEEPETVPEEPEEAEEEPEAEEEGTEKESEGPETGSEEESEQK